MRFAHRIVLLILMSGCADSVGSGAPGIVVLGGSGAPDSALAIRSEPLKVQVRGTNGKPSRGVVVRFGREPGPLPIVYTASIARPTSWQYATEDTTDGQGMASAYVRHGTLAGNATLTVTAPEVNQSTTVSYSIRPGAPVRVRILPEDTALYVGGSYALRAAVLDRHANVVGPVPITTPSPSITLTSDSVVSGVTIGRAIILTQSAIGADTSWASVVPVGTIGAHFFGRFVGDSMGPVVMNLDGSEFRRVFVTGPTPREYTPGPGGAPRWYANGQRLVFDANMDGTSRLYTAGLSGDLSRLIQRSTEGINETEPAPDWTGDWIYYVSRISSRDAILRATPDGSVVERITPVDDEFAFLRAPSPSPDGSKLAYIATRANWEIDWHLLVRDLTNGRVIQLGVKGASPAWSPAGDWIAYIAGSHSGALRVIRPDGSGDRALTTGAFFSGLTWSPDGRYMIANRADLPWVMSLINVASGEQLPLGFAHGMYGPAWRR
jgi:WD40 repeat protein